MKRLLIIFALFFSTTIIAQTALKQGTAEWLVDQFFTAINFPNKTEYFTDEMLKQVNYPTIGEELKGQATVTIREIKRNKDEFISAAYIKTKNDKKDFYCYLKNQNGWKISAIRTFIVPAYYHQLADSILNDPLLHDSTKSAALSIKLLVKTDEELKEYFKLHYNEFTNLLNSFSQGETLKVKNFLQRLNLSSIHKPDQLKDCIFFSILELEYLDAGFIYCPDNSNLPPINPIDFILVEGVVKDWYLYRRN